MRAAISTAAVEEPRAKQKPLVKKMIMIETGEKPKQSRVEHGTFILDTR